MKTLDVLGIMSGTSLDGVDYAVCRIGEGVVRLLALWSVHFPRPLQHRLHAAARNEASSWETAQLHHDLGRFYAAGARACPGKHRIQLIGLHGQTIFHNPARARPATFQLGEPAYLLEEMGVPVVGNFRAADLAAGGEGAPLATVFHQWIFGRRGAHVCVNNLGGISNVTSLDWRQGRAGQPKVLAFDTGPANVLMDLAVRHFTGGRKSCDHDGEWAARGAPCDVLIQRWLRDSYFQRPPPKSTGRKQFGEAFFQRFPVDFMQRRLSKYDVLATLVEFTAQSLVLNYRLHLPGPPGRVILTGGGAANPVLVGAVRRHLQQLNPEMQVVTSDSAGWPASAIEPAAFALLAWLRFHGRPGNLHRTTGARHSVLCGQLAQP